MVLPVGLEVDQHEPIQLVNLILQAAPAEVKPLNSQGYADYRWMAPDSVIMQIERKTWGDLLSDLGSIENQLLRQLDAHKDHTLVLLVEGIVVPSDSLLGGTAVLKKAKGQGRIYYQSSQSKVSVSALYAWLYQVSKYMEVYQTSDILGTAKAIVAFYKSDQKEGHRTFTRHLKEVTFHPNPQVTSLMGMLPGLGPIKGEALIARFGTVWEILNSTPEKLAEVYGVGTKEATRWLRLIGRSDI